MYRPLLRRGRGHSPSVPPSPSEMAGESPHRAESAMGHTVSLYVKSVTSPEARWYRQTVFVSLYMKSVTSKERWAQGHRPTVFTEGLCPQTGISSSNNRLRLIDRLLEVIMPCFNHLGSVYIIDCRVSRFRISGCLSGYGSTKPHRRVSGDSEWHSACLPIRLRDKLSKPRSALWRDSRRQLTRFVE
jgi:hypothetical protein